MKHIRAQYHFRKTTTGLDAWDVRKLIQLSEGLPIQHIDPEGIEELDLNHWYFGQESIPTPRSILQHIKLIRECDIQYPIILDQNGRVMDGMHRVCSAILAQVELIPSVRFLSDPPPDYANCDPASLPYD